MEVIKYRENHIKIDKPILLYKALLNAGEAMGLTNADIADVVGLKQDQMNGIINPESKEGTLALYLIRSYRSLYSLVDGDEEEMKLWMHGQNTATGGIPAQQVKCSEELVHVMKYLEDMSQKKDALLKNNEQI